MGRGMLLSTAAVVESPRSENCDCFCFPVHLHLKPGKQMSVEALNSVLLLLMQQPAAGPAVENVEVTASQALSLVLLMLVTGLSLAIGIKWSVIILRREHPLPSAERGLPRIPGLLTVITVAVTCLQMLAVWSASFAPADSIPPGGGAADTATAGAESDAPAELDEESRSRAWKLLLASLFMNLVICIPMAIVVLTATLNGRMQVSRPAAVRASPQMFASQPAWPDLDPGVGRTPGEVFEEPQMEGETDIPASSLPATSEVPRFSISAELMYAVEVMLAAYVPTMLLRILLAVGIKAVTGEDAPSNPLLEMITGGAGGSLLAMVIFLGIVMAPLAEELQFRVVLLGGMLQSAFRRAGLIVSSVTFSLLHGFPDGLALLPLAFALGYAYERRQSYVTVVIVHFLFNSLNLAVALLAMQRA